MERRKFILTTGGALVAAGATATVNAPNLTAQQRYQWRMATSWTPALDVLLGNAQRFARMVDELGGREDAIQAAASLAGITGKPKLLVPRRRFSITDWLQDRFGGRSFLFPGSLPPFKTPLYLMD